MRVYVVAFEEEDKPNRFQARGFRSERDQKTFRRELLDDGNEEFQMYALNIPATKEGFIKYLELFANNPTSYKFSQEQIK